MRAEVTAWRCRLASFVWLLGSGTACSAATPSGSAARPAAPTVAAWFAPSAPPAAAGPPDAERYSWQPETHTPRRTVGPPQHQLLQQHCGAPDAALQQVAGRIASRQARGEPPLETPEISFALRSAGASYVWARAWTVEGAELEDEETVLRMQQWLQSFDDGGERRCGIARASGDRGAGIVAVLVVDAVADLDPVPTRARLGQWIRLDATMLAPTRQAQLVLLGPRGAPRTVPTALSGPAVHANFSLDQVGPWTIQLLATVSGGPRPVAEALIHVDQPPPRRFQSVPAPGEQLAAGAADERAALLAMVNAVRRSEGLEEVRRHPRLEAVAQAHAEAMREAGRIGHDVGDGEPESRIQSAGLPLLAAGENVAHAASVERAHRALWSSPSHRGNLLHPRFDWVGMGVARDAQGGVWVCQVFADL